MNYDEFINKYLGKSIDYDNAYGAQCVDLIKQYLKDVFGLNPGAWGNAKDYYLNYENNSVLKQHFERIANTSSFIPQKGDIGVFGETVGSGNGHVCIATGEGSTSNFSSYDQNWSSKTVQKENHNYKGFLGVLRPKDQTKVNNNDIYLKYFDADLYKLKYEDLKDLYGDNEDALRNHFVQFGLQEGRVSTYIFDAKYYLNNHPDLKKEYGDNYTKAYNHFIKYGIKEGRRANRIFDVKYYLNNNSDLKSAFGTNYADAIQHFIDHGIHEWRKTSSGFYVKTYRDKNEDLKNAYKDSCKIYFRHYLVYGIDEGRECI